MSMCVEAAQAPVKFQKGTIILTSNRRIETARDYYRKTSGISRTLVGNKIIDNSDVVGASPVGAAPTTSSVST